MFMFKKSAMPKASDALPGRANAIRTAESHFVNGRALKGPYPPGLETAMFGFGWTSFRGQLTVHERCLVIYQRGLIAQPAIVCFPTEATARGGGLNAIALTASPTVEGSDVVLVGAGRMTGKYKIRLSTTRPKELAAAIEKMRHGVVEASPYRSPAG